MKKVLAKKKPGRTKLVGKTWVEGITYCPYIQTRQVCTVANQEKFPTWSQAQHRAPLYLESYPGKDCPGSIRS